MFAITNVFFIILFIFLIFSFFNFFFSKKFETVVCLDFFVGGSSVLLELKLLSFSRPISFPTIVAYSNTMSLGHFLQLLAKCLRIFQIFNNESNNYSWPNKGLLIV